MIDKEKYNQEYFEGLLNQLAQLSNSVDENIDLITDMCYNVENDQDPWPIDTIEGEEEFLYLIEGIESDLDPTKEIVDKLKELVEQSKVALGMDISDGFDVADFLVESIEKLVGEYN